MDKTEEKTKTKRWEVTIRRESCYEAVIELEAETEEEAQELAQTQAESGDHDDAFENTDDTFEVTDIGELED
jgi:hypothetical protein